MYDNSIYFSQLAKKESTILSQLQLTPEDFVLFTMHRDLNTDYQDRLTNIISAILDYTNQSTKKVVFPIHPRTRKMINQILEPKLLNNLYNNTQIIICDPLNFFDITHLENTCHLIVTDSGGIQKEAFFFKKPCIVLRPETEWVELVESGNAIIADANHQMILSAMLNFPQQDELEYPDFYGDGHAAEVICEHIINQFESTKG